MNSYIWGGNTGMTYEDMLRQNQQAERLQQQAGQAEGPGAGFNILAKNFTASILNKRADAARKQGMDQMNDQWNQAVGGSALGHFLQQRVGGGTPFAEGAPQPAPQKGVAGAFEGAAEASGQFPASLIRTESGGNWNALNKEGYGGRLQFGDARLADAAAAGLVPQGTTGAVFSRMSPDQQQAVESWHFADIDKQAQRMGLDRYVGQNVGGQPITQDSIRAMAHLGGIGGAAKFLQSGGQSNPADSNGTSLADYARIHAGGGQSQPQQAPQAGGMDADMAQIASLMGNPFLDEGRRSVLGTLLQQRMGRQDAAWQQQMDAQDPMRQMEMEKARLELEQLRTPEQPKPMEINGQLVDPTNGQVLGDYRTQGGAGPMPTEVQALQWRAQEAGLVPGTPEYQEFIRSGGRSGQSDPAAFAALDRQAQAAGLEPGTPEYQSFMATRGAGLAAEATAIGKAQGESTASAPGDYQTAQNALDLIDSIRNDPNRQRGTGKSAVFNAIPGTGGYDFQTKVEQAKGGAFLTAVQTMKGLGALSNNEGAAATSAITRMNTASTEEGFMAALEDYEKIVRQGMARAAAKGGGPVPDAQPSQPAQRRRFNPQTRGFE